MAPARTLVTALAAAYLCADALAFAPSRRAGLPSVGPRRTVGPRSTPMTTPSMALFDDLADGFSSLVSGGGKVEAEPALPTVVIEPDFKLAAITTALALVLDSIPYIQFILGPIVTLLAVLFAVQTTRIRFRFDDDSFELLGAGADGELEDSGENIVVGGANRWTYDSFVNWEFFPEGWIDQPQGPILVYFKETQTPEAEWEVGPGQSANSAEALAKGAVRGQVHFFPALCDTKQLREEFTRRGCAKL